MRRRDREIEELKTTVRYLKDEVRLLNRKLYRNELLTEGWRRVPSSGNIPDRARIASYSTGFLDKSELWYKVDKPEAKPKVVDWQDGVRLDAGMGWKQIPGSRFEIKTELIDPLGVFHIRKRPKGE